MHTFRVRVPCSTSNLGAGFDCIGLAFNRHLDATLHVSGSPLRIERGGTLQAIAETAGADLVVNAMRAAGADPGGELILESDIPIGRGLGSSAAASVAGVMLAAQLRGEKLERDVIAAQVAEIEGHPDNAVPATFGGLLAAMTEVDGDVQKVRITRLRLSNRVRFVFAAPHAIVSTKAARRALPDQIPHAAAIRSIARTVALIEGLAEGDPDLLRIGFSDELHVPYRLPMIAGGEAVLAAAVAAGAFAATISGSGSGMVAICPPGAEDAVLASMKAAFEQATAAEAIAFIAEVDHAGAHYMAT